MNRRENGFTLIELVVALALFAVIYVVTFETLSTVLNGSEIVNAEQKRWHDLDMTFLQMKEDLNFANNRQIRDGNGGLLPALMGGPTDSRALSRPTLEISRSGLVALNGNRETGLRRVGYRLKERNLYREIWPVLDRKYDSEPASLLLANDVEDFSVRYLDKNGQWSNEWPRLGSTGSSGLPVAVDVSLTLADDMKINRWFIVNG